MKRIASVFRKKSQKASQSTDHDRGGPHPALPPSLSTTTLERRSGGSNGNGGGQRDPRPPPMLTPNNPAYSSSASASSTGSTDLRTPDDDRTSSRLPSPAPASRQGKKAWISSWVGSRRSGSQHRSATKDVFDGPAPPIPTAVSQPPATPNDGWQPRPAPTLLAPPLPRTRVAEPPPPPRARDASDEDTTSESGSESDDLADPAIAPGSPATYAPSSARANLRLATQQGLVPPFSPPPLLHLPGKPLFPRAANPPGALCRQESVRTALLKGRVLRRLDRRGAPLSPAEERSIAPFAQRVPGVRAKRASFQLDESAVSDTKRIGSYSRGLKRWAERPCFENRLMNWEAAADGSVTCSRVVGRPGFALADLEFSASLELLAGMREDDIPATLEPTSSASSSTSQLVPPRVAIEYKPSPSPLRMQYGTPASPGRSLSSPAIAAQSVRTPTSAESSPKLGVRFAATEDQDGTDSTLLGYALQQRKQREEKARFLKEERERRAHEDERRRMEAERAQWDRDRAQWERERKAADDERRQRKFAEEVAAQRQRQSSHRAGHLPSSSRSSIDREGDRRATTVSLSDPHGRPAAHGSPKPSPRRQYSEPATAMTTSGTSYRGASPANSRPPSLAGSASMARPSSTYSAGGSTEDVRMRHNGQGTAHSRGPSNTADASDRGRRGRRTSTHSATSLSGRPASMAVGAPPVPPMPGQLALPYGTGSGALDMPLLPPAAPFMTQHYGGRARSGSRDSDRPRSTHSSGSPARSTTPSSVASGSRRSLHAGGALPGASYSSDRVNVARPAAHRRQSSGGDYAGASNGYAGFGGAQMAMPAMPRSGSMPVGYWGMPMGMQGYMPMQPVVVYGSPTMASMPGKRQSVIF